MYAREPPPHALVSAQAQMAKLRGLEDMTGLLDSYPAGTAALIYHLPRVSPREPGSRRGPQEGLVGARPCTDAHDEHNRAPVEMILIDSQGIAASARSPAGVDQIDDLGRALRAQIAAGLPLEPSRTAQPMISAALPVDARQSLTEALLPDPVSGALREVRHLIIVPVASIGTVPFAVLDPWGEGRPLIERMSISIAPGLHTLADEIEPWGASFDRPLLVGDPADTGLPALPGARQEVLALALHLGATALIGPDATRRAVMAQIHDADLLYFATHGQADPSNPLDGGALILASGAALSARKLQSMKLHARLAVLSACDTGLGAAHEGGTIGLSRAVHLAGVPRVVMSLWPVNDQATQALMLGFMKHLPENPPAEALRLAMLEVRLTHPSPQLWASFAIFGTPR